MPRGAGRPVCMACGPVLPRHLHQDPQLPCGSSRHCHHGWEELAKGHPCPLSCIPSVAVVEEVVFCLLEEQPLARFILPNPISCFSSNCFSLVCLIRDLPWPLLVQLDASSRLVPTWLWQLYPLHPAGSGRAPGFCSLNKSWETACSKEWLS